MRYCKHTQWLGLASDGDVFLQNTDRLYTLLEDLPDPDKQCPSLLVFIGSKSKGMAIKELAKSFSPPPRYCNSSPSGEVHLHIHPPSSFSNRPVLLAEGNLPYHDKYGATLTVEDCHELERRKLNSINTVTPTLSGSSDRIYSRLLLPFAEVICFFADDVGGFKPIVQHLGLWLDLGPSSTLPKTTLPKLLIITEPRYRTVGDDDSDLITFTKMLREETTININEHFSDIRLLSLSPQKENLSNKARHRKLFESLLNYSDQVREAKISTRTLFCARHVAAFFSYALNHVATSQVEPFNFIKASRIEIPVVKTLKDHLVDFLQNIKTPSKLLQFGIPILTSSLLLDSYPPDMHFFNSLEVFRTLYKETYYQACRSSALTHDGSKNIILPSEFVRLLECDLALQTKSFARLPETSRSAWRLEKLAEFRSEWLTMHSEKTCFVCNMRRPQYRLPCQHFVCETCVRRFGVQVDKWSFNVPKCFLCGRNTSGFVITVKPPTATVRLLCIDGGGPRGIIPLVFLQALQEKIGLPYPVQGNFHFVFGTSSGGIIALALGHNGWPVEDCMDHFVRLAKRAFSTHRSSYLYWLSHIRAILFSLVTNGIYPAQKMDAVLQEVFGDSSRILDHSAATAMGIKLGIVVSTMKPETVIFTNYNGVGDREQRKYDYGVLLGNALVWEVARCTSAAPGIFTPKSIDGLGKFQDGGLAHNNPINLALEEIKTLFRGDPSAKRSTLKVSLGTGESRDDDPQIELMVERSVDCTTVPSILVVHGKPKEK
ncbi:acyl transferase/acyl hydrolase/lysophospholipase [Xylogone sp. PMI_703]|nr:acyl transferase/acyl hydrolase/lysophospholipase [Xylogone sp. PMI_703]